MSYRAGSTRSRRRWLTLCGVLVAAGCYVSVAGAQSVTPQQPSPEPIPHKILKANFPNKTAVVVQGWVAVERAVPQQSFLAFYLRDRFGDLLLIRTTKTLPGINTEIRVKGVALLDSDTREPYVLEEVRDSLKVPTVGPGRVVESIETGAGTSVVSPDGKSDYRTDGAGPAGPGAGGTGGETKASPSTPGSSSSVSESATPAPIVPVSRFAWLTWPWITGFSVLGLGLIVGALMLVMSRRKPRQEGGLGLGGPQVDPWQNAYLSPAAPAASASDLIHPVADSPIGADLPVLEDYKTVKSYKTGKVLPGRLVVMENQKETDVIHLSDQTGRGEIEIGRDSPDATGGVRIKDKSNTLSRRQAKLVYSSTNREFSLLNLIGESGNPTVVNGRAMHENEAIVLKDGDVMGMGSVDLKFKRL